MPVAPVNLADVNFADSGDPYTVSTKNSDGINDSGTVIDFNGRRRLKVVSGLGNKRTTKPKPVAQSTTPSIAQPSKLPSPFADHQPSNDLLTELTDNLHEYDGDECWLNINRVPLFIKLSLSKCKQKYRKLNGRNPTLSRIASCAISIGCHTLFAHPAVTRFREIRERFDSIDNESTTASRIDEIATWFYECPLGSPESISGMSKPQIVDLPRQVRADLSQLSDELGMPLNALAILCICISLSNQTTFMLTGHLEQAAASVSKFLGRMVTKVEIGKLLIDYIEANEQTEEN